MIAHVLTPMYLIPIRNVYVADQLGCMLNLNWNINKTGFFYMSTDVDTYARMYFIFSSSAQHNAIINGHW